MSDERKSMEPVPVPDEAIYGITIWQTDGDKPVVTVSGSPDMGQLQRLILSAQINLQANITAEKVVALLKKQPKILKP